MLAPQAEACGHRLLVFDTLASTNNEAMDQARSGARGDLWVTTPRQIGGRGRRGRAWEMPRGNLAVSWVVDVNCEPGLTATIGFAAGVALYRAVAMCAPHLAASGALKLKWPNDLLINGAKASGMLLESEFLPQGRRVVVIGIGVNVAAAPDMGGAYAVTSLREAGAHVSAEALLEALSATWLEAAAGWDDGRGMDRIRRQWLENAAGVGERVMIRFGDEIIAGTFDTIDASGQLLVRLDGGGVRAIAAGDVHFGDVGTWRGEASAQDGRVAPSGHV